VTTVVSDTSPINYLCLIDAIDVLPKLFDEILIPPTVLAELRHPRAPRAVSDWLFRMPTWVKIQAPRILQTGLGLDPGETEAISLAIELNLPVVLVDERAGRMVVEERGITAFGTLNILYLADLRELLDFETAVNRLRRTNFHLEQRLLEAVLAKVRARKNSEQP
jgi:predicted nucleic acid-binding protein